MDETSGGDIYVLNLSYVGKNPAAKQLDAAMPDCLVVATQKDGRKGILATPWFRKKAGASHDDDENAPPARRRKLHGLQRLHES